MAEETASERPPTKVFLLNTDPDLRSGSLCRRAYNSALEAFSSPGYEIVTTDLLVDGWNMPLSVADFKKLSDPVHVNLRTEQMVSPLIQKIVDEQTKLLQSDLFIIFAPLSSFVLPSHFSRGGSES